MTTTPKMAPPPPPRAGHQPPDPPQPLTADQRARAAALREARTVLAARGPLTTAAVDSIDLVNVASWILDGRDPWSAAATENTDPDVAARRHERADAYRRLAFDIGSRGTHLDPEDLIRRAESVESGELDWQFAGPIPSFTKEAL